MTTTHYSDAQGNYLGGFSGGAQPPSGSVERPAPATGRDVWQNGAWVTPDLPIDERRAAMVVSRFQAKAALANAGLLSAAETAVSGASATAQLAWSEAVEFRRNSPTIAALAMALYPGETQETVDTNLDALFTAAALIEA